MEKKENNEIVLYQPDETLAIDVRVENGQNGNNDAWCNID